MGNAPNDSPHGGLVYVVDDSESMREALVGLIRSAGHQVEAFESAQLFLAHGGSTEVSCLVLDIELPGLSGLDLQDRLVADRGQVPIIFISGHADVPRSVRAMKGGAFEFLTKPFSDVEILDAIERALAQSRDIRAHSAAADALRARYQTLTVRERQVMGLVVAGRLNKQIAADSLPDLVRMAERLTPGQSR
jgi:FixJ family two-component response regulator